MEEQTYKSRGLKCTQIIQQQLIINDTATHTGRFGKIVALQDSVINTLVAENITENDSNN